MKKAFLLLLLLALNMIAFAQAKPVIVTGQMYHAKDTTRTFGVLEMDKDLCIKKLINSLGNPVTNTTGNITWNKVTIKGLDKPLQLHIRDGIMTHYPSNSSASWSPFTSEADKQQKLAALNKDQERDMEMELTDQSGNNIVNSKEEEKMITDFLVGILE